MYACELGGSFAGGSPCLAVTVSLLVGILETLEGTYGCSLVDQHPIDLSLHIILKDFCDACAVRTPQTGGHLLAAQGGKATKNTKCGVRIY